MHPPERILLFGPYSAPAFRYGDIVTDARRGDVTIVAVSESKIPWPMGRTHKAQGPVLFGDLITAVQRESSAAICHWWGVSTTTVTAWRRVVGVEHVNEGTRTLKADVYHFGESWTADEDVFVCHLSPREAALMTGRTITSVYARRQKLGLYAWNVR